MTNMNPFFFTSIFCLMAVLPAIAEDISFEATVDADRVVMGSAVQLTLTAHGTQDIKEAVLPAVDGFEAHYVGPSTQVQVVNGEYSSAKSFTYMLLPLKEGKFTIPSVEVQIKGQAYQTKPLVIDVVSASAAPDGSKEAADPLHDPQVIADRVRMVISVPDAASFVYQEVPLTVRLYVCELPVQDISFPQITQEGFLLSEFARPKQYQETSNGKVFEVVEFNALLTPTREGELTVGPAVMTGNLVIRNNVRRNPFGGGVFEDDFFAGFFNSYQKKPMTITSRPLTLTAKPLPQEGKPDGFSGAVGRFTFDVSAAPLQVKAGDPVTLKMSVAGMGDLKTIRMPEFKSDGFKNYDPQVKETDGQKMLEQVIVPLKEGKTEIPAITFHYFDTSTSKYETITRGPFSIDVLPMEKGQEFQAVGFAERAVPILKESLGNDIVFIKDRPGLLVKKTTWLGRNAWPLVVLLVYFHLWCVFLYMFVYRRKLMKDPVFARKSIAMSTARAAMKELKPLIREGGGREFYAQLFRVLNDYLEKKLDIPPGNMDPALVEAELASYVEKRRLAFLSEFYDLAERARFASASVSVQDMERSFLDMEELLDEIERRVR